MSVGGSDWILLFAGGIDLEEFTAALKTDQWEEVNRSIGWGELVELKVHTHGHMLVLG